MTVNILFESGERKDYSQVDKIIYHEGFVEIQETYYLSDIFPSKDIKKITQESRRSY